MNTINQEKNSKTIWAVPIYLLLCFYYFGSVMMVHFVIYPHFDKVHDNFQKYIEVYNNKMLWFCYLPALLMVLAAINLWRNCPKEFPRWTILSSAVLAFTSVATTFFVLLPITGSFLAAGFNETVYQHWFVVSKYFQILPALAQVIIAIILFNIYLKDTKPFARWVFIVICILNFYTSATGWTESFVAYPLWQVVSPADWLTYRGSLNPGGFIIFFAVFLLPAFLPMILMVLLFWWRPKAIPAFYLMLYVIAFLWMFGITAAYFVPHLQLQLDKNYSSVLIAELRKNDLLLRFTASLIICFLPVRMLNKIGKEKMKQRSIA